MKNRIPIIVTVLLLGAGMTACTDRPNDNYLDASDAEAMKQDVAVKTGELKSTLVASLDRADREIDQLSEKIEMRGEAAMDESKEEYHQMIADLRSEREAIAEETEGLKVETEAAFEESQRDLRERLDQLNAKVTEARLSMIDSREEFEAAVQSEMQSVNQEISNLESKIASEGADVSEDYEPMLADLKQSREELQSKWRELSDATGESFEEIRDNVIVAIAQLDREISTVNRKLDRTMET